MQLPEYLTIEAGYALFCPCGPTTFEEGTAQIGSAIEFCRERNIPKMLIDITGLTGIRAPTVVDRFWFAQLCAEKARGAMTIAMVAPPELIDPRKFGVTAAHNLGLKGDVFTSRSQAIDWLLNAKTD